MSQQEPHEVSKILLLGGKALDTSTSWDTLPGKQSFRGLGDLGE